MLHIHSPKYKNPSQIIIKFKSSTKSDQANIYTQQWDSCFVEATVSQKGEEIAKQVGRAVLRRPLLSRMDFLNVRVPDVLLAFPVKHSPRTHSASPH